MGYTQIGVLKNNIKPYIIKELLRMCLCDNKYFKVTNITTGKTKLYTRAASIARRFDTFKEFVFDCIKLKGVFLRLNGERYKVEVNKLPECEEVRKDIIQKHGVRLGKMPDRCRQMQTDADTYYQNIVSNSSTLFPNSHS